MEYIYHNWCSYVLFLDWKIHNNVTEIRHFWVPLTVLHGLQIRGYVSRLIKAFRLLQEGPTVCPP